MSRLYPPGCMLLFHMNMQVCLEKCRLYWNLKMSLLFKGVPYSQVPAVHLANELVRCSQDIFPLQKLQGISSRVAALHIVLVDHLVHVLKAPCVRGVCLVWKAPKMSRNPRFFLERLKRGSNYQQVRAVKIGPTFAPKGNFIDSNC